VAFDPSKPSMARAYDFLLGGKDNFAPDRELAQQVLKIYPQTAELMRENRAFLSRAVTYIAERGVSQFLDVGAGMPTSPNTHEVTREVNPAARIVYLDIDPVVISHASALLATNDGVAAIHGDARAPEAIAADPELLKVIDLSEPACVILGMVLHFLDAATARDIVASFSRLLAPGSYVVISAGRAKGEVGEQMTQAYSAASLYNHSKEEITSFFGDLDLVPPGLVEARSWRAEWAHVRESDQTGQVLVGVGHKPTETE
jgi:SAM-dependent methyltransferase